MSKPSGALLSTYYMLKAHGVDRRTFFCTATAAALGLEPWMVPHLNRGA
jgi:hypothetical protein